LKLSITVRTARNFVARRTEKIAGILCVFQDFFWKHCGKRAAAQPELMIERLPQK
jgi:hypothetical protein